MWRETGLAALWLLGAPQLATAQEPSAADNVTFEQLRKECAEAFVAWREAYTELESAGDKQAIDAHVQQFPNRAFAPRFLAAAKAHEGEPEAYVFLEWLLNTGQDPECHQEAMALLVRDHLDRKELRNVAAAMRFTAEGIGVQQSLDFLDLLVDESPVAEVQQQAQLVRATLRAADPETREEAVIDLEDLVGQGGDLAKEATGALFEAQHLQIGMVAPDIEAADLDGVTFKLSDYRGKVVVLDFWGDW